ncbi:ankyrin repeat-containing domain protein [Schizothecium vesticola]|uniref:Ankyrin repeat-containing domain protein n=1 Tax=Schizothecium vesticola TaxID=314040 RepID=A0AA40K1P2_9PEZI|nr:ankyrin repeat-containing domain protein [Schizothecium vesticola]
MDSIMLPTSSSTLDVKPLEWCGIDGPRASAFSRSASEEALARMGWKATLGRPKPSECREIVRPNLSLRRATPSVVLHNDDCDCQPRQTPAPIHQQNPQDEALALYIFSTSETYRGREKAGPITIQRAKATNSKELRRRPSSIASFARLFSSATPTSPINGTSKSAELCQACSDLDPDLMARLLFEDRTPVNATNPSDGTTPLLAAISSPKARSYPSSHLAIITLLLDRGADPNAVAMSTDMPASQTTPLIAACTINAPEVVKLLLTRGAAVDAPPPSPTKLGFRSRGMTALHTAAAANHPDCVDILLAHGGANVATAFDYVKPIAWPNHTQPKSDSGSLSRRSSISSISNSSIRSGLLLRVPTAKRPLATTASSAASIRSVKMADDRNLTPVKGVTPLYLASGSYACTGLLLRHTAPANVRDSQGRTPLHWATEAGDADVVSLLLDAGNAEVDPHDNQGTTPLGLAVAKAEKSGGTVPGQRAAEVEMMRVLLQAGANVDIRCGKATTLRARLLAIDGKDRWRRVFGPLLDQF